MNAFNFSKLAFIFIIFAFFGNFENTGNEISKTTFEQSFVRLKLRKMSSSEKKSLQNQMKILEQKVKDAKLAGNEEKASYFQGKIDSAKKKLAE
ncbi:uncharacterized protein cubi_01245 [Cryptosporidium ubiquitum]|uniref:Uncharacterized protein n=1 Tax=Cryptosporidium ubiquitum TaxID=857276 RepID=A0A1J4M9K5_9CRYT|nr:uncharacterized protein cubi_01245 [Cryptosporidium ubiquitum]OII70904.1 hypothetical protein cubi_01245 [Cryptosporidium ubiquitum]